jgi:hypothetical protein
MYYKGNIATQDKPDRRAAEERYRVGRPCFHSLSESTNLYQPEAHQIIFFKTLLSLISNCPFLGYLVPFSL